MERIKNKGESCEKREKQITNTKIIYEKENRDRERESIRDRVGEELEHSCK